ncbi:MAG: hypothetical protein ACKVZH_21885 [Blastocatellia bacterium]
MPEIGTGLTVAKAAVDIIKGAKKGGWLDSLLAIFRKKHKVLLLGCSGVGKTLFRDSLKTDVVPKPIPRDERTRKDDSYKITFAGRPFEFFDQSGQLIEGPRRDGVTRQAGGENAGTIGIINVVAYGYHVGPTHLNFVMTSICVC